MGAEHPPGWTGQVDPGWRRLWPIVSLCGVVVGAFGYALALFAMDETIPRWGSQPVASSVTSLFLFAAMFGLCFGSVIWFPVWAAGALGGGLVLLATPKQSSARGARLRRLAFSAATALCSSGTAWIFFLALFRTGGCGPGSSDKCMYDFSSVLYDPAVAASAVLVLAALVSWWYAPIPAPAQRGQAPHEGW